MKASEYKYFTCFSCYLYWTVTLYQSVCKYHIELIHKLYLINKQLLLVHVLPGSATTPPTARHRVYVWKHLLSCTSHHITPLVQTPATNISVQVHRSTLSWGSISRSRELQCTVHTVCMSTAPCEQENTVTATEREMFHSHDVGYWAERTQERVYTVQTFSKPPAAVSCSISTLSNKSGPEDSGASKTCSSVESKNVLPFSLKRELKRMIHVLLHWSKPSSEKHQGTVLHAVQKQDLL